MTGRIPCIHDLKVWPEFYADIESGVKPFEVRVDDRDPRYQVGDVLRLREWSPKTGDYTGRVMERSVCYTLRAPAHPGIASGHVIMGLRDYLENQDDTVRALRQEIADLRAENLRLKARHQHGPMSSG